VPQELDFAKEEGLGTIFAASLTSNEGCRPTLPTAGCVIGWSAVGFRPGSATMRECPREQIMNAIRLPESTQRIAGLHWRIRGFAPLLVALAMTCFVVPLVHAASIVTFNGGGRFGESLAIACGQLNFGEGGTYTDGVLTTGNRSILAVCAATQQTNTVATAFFDAQPDALRATAKISSAGPLPGFNQPLVLTSARVDGVIRFIGPTATVVTSLNLRTSGAVTANGPASSTTSFGRSAANALVSVKIGDYAETDTRGTTFESRGGIVTYSDDPNSSLFDANQTLLFTVPTNVDIAFSYFLSLSAEATVDGASPSYFAAIADYENTVALPINADVFNLPDGYTVNSDGFGIVNNRIRATIEPPPSAVPEPPVSLLILAGLVGIMTLRTVGGRGTTHR
jgi:hypothetical protein